MWVDPCGGCCDFGSMNAMTTEIVVKLTLPETAASLSRRLERRGESLVSSKTLNGQLDPVPNTALLLAGQQSLFESIDGS